MKAYLANGLFNEADRMFNEYLARKLREQIPNIDLFVPQESAEINDKSAYADSKMIAEWDTRKLLESDILIAIIDGVEVDSGVATEIGIFSTTKRPMFVLYSDVRQQGRDNQKKIQALIEDGTESQFFYRNLFLIGTIKNNNGKIFDNSDELVKAVKEYVEGELK
jgi:nucleoside 2-deoxyribosyltransferase